MDEIQNDRLDPQVYAGRGKRLLRHVWAHFKEDRCLEEAASLGYTSLLSLVPLLAVVFGIIAAFPVFNEWSEMLQSFIFDNFMPSTGEQIVPYIDKFLSSVSRLTLPGMLALLATALLLLNRIEAAFNRIWRVAKGRTLLNRVVMYWAVLTLVPLLIAAGVAFSAQSVLGFLGDGESMNPAAYRIVMFLMGWAVFTLMFLVVPNRSVQVRHALSGAFLSAVLFEIAKTAFVAYVSNTNYAVIYGALATIPIFLFWIYLVWAVILFGASLAASLTTFSDFRRSEAEWPERWNFQMTFRLLGHFREAQKRGESLTREKILDLEKEASEIRLLKLVEGLEAANLVAGDEDGNWFLRRDLEDMTLGDLYCAGGHYLPFSEVDDLPNESAWDLTFARAIETIRQGGKPAWSQSLRTMYSQEGDTGHGDTD